MKQRVFTGWNRMRGVYLVTGLIIIIQAAVNEQWPGIALGGYFVAMAVLRLGCAAGTFFNGSCDVKSNNSGKGNNIF